MIGEEEFHDAFPVKVLGNGNSAVNSQVTDRAAWTMGVLVCTLAPGMAGIALQTEMRTTAIRNEYPGRTMTQQPLVTARPPLDTFY